MIIPFASGAPVTIGAGFGAAIGFGKSTAGAIDVSGASFDLTSNGPLNEDNMAFSMPRDGTLVELTALFTTSVDVSMPPGTTVRVALYISQTLSQVNDNIFSLLGAIVTLPLPSAFVSANTTTNGTQAFMIPVSKQDRLILVTSVNVPGDPVQVVRGWVSAGLAIV